jgi:hypothetical protein
MTNPTGSYWDEEPDRLLPPPDVASVYGLDLPDIGKGMIGKFAQGVTGIAGLPGAIGDWSRAAAEYAGVPEKSINQAAAISRSLPITSAFTGPNPTAIQRKVEEYTGPFYNPQSLAGQYAGSVAEFAPSAVFGGGGVFPRVINTVVPALMSETAGQLTKGEPSEPWMRGGAGVFGGLAGAKLITPTAPPSPAWQRAATTLERAGIPLSAGDRTGSNMLRWLETSAGDMPLSGRIAQESLHQKALGVDKAFTEKAFNLNALPPGEYLPRQNVMAAGRKSLGDTYDRLSAAYGFRARPELFQDFADTLTKYEGNVIPSLRAAGKRDSEAVQNEIRDKLAFGPTQWEMSGDQYQKLRSRLGRMANSAYKNDPDLGNALKEMRDALDNTMMSRLPPDAVKEWIDTNRRWANMKQLEQASATAGEHLSPAGIAQSVRKGRETQYAQGKGDLDELAQAAKTVLKPLPQTGTTPRQMWQNFANIPTSVHAISAGGGALGSVFGWPGAVMGVAAPHVAAGFAVSKPGQAWLGNQVAPQKARDVLTQTITQQAATQPGGIERNEAEQVAYEQKRMQDLRDLGLR